MRRLSLFVCAVAATTLATPAFADLIQYGDFAAATVDYLDVSEFSNTDTGSLFGAPAIAGNSLFFNGLTFAAAAKGLGGADNTAGILSTTIAARAGEAINGLAFRESGSVTLSGLGNNAYASVSGAYHLNVLEIDGAPVDPINLDTLMSFDPSDGDFSIDHDGVGTDLWEGLLTIDLDAMLAAHGYSGSATRVSVMITNTLSALSQDGTSAVIAKKSVSIGVLPTPSAALLLVLGAVTGGRRRRL